MSNANLKEKILHRLGQLVWLGVLTFVLSVIAGTTLYVFAAFTEPAAGPSESNQDFAQNILGANNANNLFDSSLVAASSSGSIIERLEYVQAYCTGDCPEPGGTATAADLFNGKTAYLAGDWSIDTGTLDLACNTATFNGTANLVADAYDGGGAGNNRWCMTDSGDAANTDIASGKVAWVDGVAVTGTASGGYTYGDSDPWYVLGTADGAGLAMKDTWSGSSTTYVYPQSAGGVDDCNYNGSACDSYPVESYGSSTPWTQCTAANYYCGTSATTTCSGDVCWRDDSTGLVWSDQISSSIDWFAANNCEDDALRGDGTCSTHGEENCQCFKKTSSKTGCEGLADAGWRLPDQKEWMLGYVNGMQNHIPNTSSGSTFYYFWSATTRSNYTFLAWVVYPALGFVTNFNKTSNYRARCVR